MVNDWRNCRECDVRWRGEDICWSCGKRVTPFGGAMPLLNSQHGHEPEGVSA